MTKTIPVLANTRPWNELILRGDRKIKSIHFNWKHRGRILLYNTRGPQDWNSSFDHGVSDQQPAGVIVGSVVVTEVRHIIGNDYEVALSKPRRFKRPIPYSPAHGAVRISLAPLSLLTRGKE